MNIQVKDYAKAVEHFNQEINNQTKGAPFIGDGALLEWCNACEDSESIETEIETGFRTPRGDVQTFEPSEDFKSKYLEINNA